MNYIKFTLCACVMGLLAGCSSGGNMKVLATAAPSGLPAVPSARLVVNPVDKDSDDVLSDVRSAVLGQLQATGHFSKVIVGSEATDLIITVDITKYSKVTVGERLLVGALAGRNRVATQVKIIQTAGNVTIKSFEAEGESAAHPLSSESGLSDAVREVAKQIASAAIV